MKSTIFVSLLMMSFCLASHTTSAQDQMNPKEDPIKEQFVETYAWTKAHFENKTEPIVSIKQMQTAEGSEFIQVETKAAKILYDTSGKQYCSDHAELNCAEFYKLSDGDLSWKKS